MKQRIMIVDDDAFQRCALLAVLERNFRGRDVAIAGFAGPADALASAQASDVSVVIADYRMPGMDGVEFLRRIRALRPRCVRLMLTAHGDMATAIDAVNQAEVFRYLQKPWSADLLGGVRDALARHRMLERDWENATATARAETLEQRALRELEASEPGITHVRWSHDGAVIFE
jgi:DNA-binding NtrC family response regulator